MSGSSKWSNLHGQLSQLGFSKAAADAARHGAELDAEERAADARTRQIKSAHDAVHANVRAGRERARLSGGKLPDGFHPVRGAKALFQLGHWTSLGDGMPPILPMHTMALLGRRGADHPDTKTWMAAYSRALRGEVEGLQEMGEIAETGRYNTPIDVQRAFFWYYRAGLAGDTEARARALALKRENDIDPATMDEPQLLYPGRWRVTMDNFGQGSTIAILDLDGTGSVNGEVESFGGAAMGTIDTLTAGDTDFQNFMASMIQSMVIDGRWSYDPKRFMLRLELLYSSPTIPGGQPQSSEIQLAGVSDDLILFGRDRTLTSFYFQPVNAG